MLVQTCRFLNKYLQYLCYNLDMSNETTIKNIIICGLGAIGSIYAYKISNCSNFDLRILVDNDRLKKYEKTPVIFNNEPLKLKYILPEDTNFKADLVIISTKYNGLKSAIKNLRNFVGENTIVLSLLNGITSEKIIAEEFGDDKILYSYFIGHSAVRKGNKTTQDGVNTIVFGHPNKNNRNVIKVKNFFDVTGINYEIPEDIIHSMWLKFLLNVSSNQTSAVLNLTFGDMQNNPMCMKFIKNIAKEVTEIAKAEGVKGTETFEKEYDRAFLSMSPDGKTSMLQDVLAKRKTEVEIFAQTVVELGKKHNIQTPYNLVLKEMIDIIEWRNNAV